MDALKPILANVSSTDLYIALGTIVVLFIFYSLKSNKRGPNDPPLWTSVVPFFGVLSHFAKGPMEFFYEGRKRYGNIFTAFIFGQKITFIAHPEGHDVFFKSKEEEFSSREVYQFVTPIFGKGIVYDTTPNIMAEQLKFVTQGLTVPRFKIFVKQFEKECEIYFANYAKEGKVDCLTMLSELTVNTASRALMGRELRENLKESQFSELYHDMESSLNPLTFFMPWVPSFSARKRDKARAEIVALFTKIVENRRKNPTGEKHEDVIQTLMEAKFKDGGMLSMDQISGMLIALLFAGQHTSSITSTWTLVNIISNPKALERVLAEQREVIAKHGPELSFEAVKDMEYLHLCMKESLRLNPPLSMLFRKVHVDKECLGRTIPANSIACVCPAASHRLSDVFTNPNQFDPERLEEPREEDKKFEYAFAAFGGGRHRCLGENFGYLQVKTIVSWILRHYELEFVSPYPPKVDYTSMVAGPMRPMDAKFKRREAPLA